MTDPIADMLTRIRNASLVHKKEVSLPFSKIKLSIAKLLVESGYLESVEENKDQKPYILIKLKYNKKQPAISYIKRVSKPGLRIYVKSSEIKNVLNGFGMSILSTPKGLKTDEQARAEKLGGELICEIY